MSSLPTAQSMVTDDRVASGFWSGGDIRHRASREARRHSACWGEAGGRVGEGSKPGVAQLEMANAITGAGHVARGEGHDK